MRGTCHRCEREIISDTYWEAVVAEHHLTDPQALVAGVLCSDHLAEFLQWIRDGEPPEVDTVRRP